VHAQSDPNDDDLPYNIYGRDGSAISYLFGVIGHRTGDDAEQAKIWLSEMVRSDNCPVATFLLGIIDDCQHSRIMITFGSDVHDNRREQAIEKYGTASKTTKTHALTCDEVQ
jgi:hypothetical protein